MNSLTKSLSTAYGTDGILVNAESPAFIMTLLVAAESNRGADFTPR